MKLNSKILVLGVLSFVVAQTAYPQRQSADKKPQTTVAQKVDAAELKKDIDALKEGQAAIQKQLEEIKKLLSERQMRPANDRQEIVLNIADLPHKGNDSASLVLVEFSDYQ